MDDVMYAHIGQGTGVTKKRILKKTQQALRPSRILKPTHQEQQRAAPGAESDIYNGFVQACEKTCYQRDVIKNCQCSDAYYPPSNASAFNHVVVPVCSTSNITQGNSTQTPLHRFVVDLMYKLF